MILTLFLFFASAITIYLSCEFFVNAVEWLGRKLNLGSTATGTVLAAFGTALPESAVTFTAVVFGKSNEKSLGVGAAIGGPLVLATIAYGVVGFVLWRTQTRNNRRDSAVKANCPRLARDQAYFLLIFALKVALGLFAFAWKPWLGLVFLLAYAAYVWREIAAGQEDQDDHEEELEPLKFSPKSADPSVVLVALQLLAALGVIAVASHTFVQQLAAIGAAAGLAPHIVALLLSPVATELPETMNAIIWVRQGKERLALANISGAMMIQATIPSALGMIFTPWIFDSTLLVASAVTTFAIGFLWYQFRKGPVHARSLIKAAFLYLIFAGYALWHHHV